MSKRETPHGTVSERFMRHHYGASGFVPKEKKMQEPTLGDTIPAVIDRAKSLIEWMPRCSPGSSGHIRRVKLEEALELLEAAWAIARL